MLKVLVGVFALMSLVLASVRSTPYPSTFGTAISQGYLKQGSEFALFERSGIGYISYIWWTGAEADSLLGTDTILSYYVDGNPPLTVTLDMLAGIGFGDPAAPWGTEHFGKGAATGGVYSTLRVPFSKSIQITAQTNGPDLTFWFVVRGQMNAPILLNGLPLPLNAQLKLYQNLSEVIQPLTYVNLVNTQNAGLVWAHTLAVQSANLNYLEGCYRAYVQGAAEPWLLSSGTEDYFQSAFYFNAGPFHVPEAGLSHWNATAGTLSAYKVRNYDALWFEAGGFEMKWRVGEYYDPNTGLKCVDTGNIVGNPQVSTVTAYTWTYEWE